MKTWQVIVFSLVPLALVFAGVTIASMRGVDASREIFPTPPPAVEGSVAPPPAAPAGTTALEITASNLSYDKSSLTAAAGKPVQLTFHNKDAGVSHNFSVYTDRGASQSIFKGDLVTGPADHTYTFDAPSTPGSYYYHCDVHPDSMSGTFVVQ